jgi:hypothetical protein
MKVKAIGSAETGLFLMNNLCTENEASVSGKHISDLDSWDSQPYVKTLLPKKYSEDDRRVRHLREGNHNINQEFTLKLLSENENCIYNKWPFSLYK